MENCEQSNKSEKMQETTERLIDAFPRPEVEAKDQASRGDLTRQDEPSRYRNIAWITDEVALDQISHFNLLPDYFLPTEANRPSVAKTPSGYYCLDGWDLVEMARSKGSSSIVVDVDEMEAHSDEELCIRKMALRLKTRGVAVYAEIIRNSRDIYRMLLATNEDLKVFSHGGRRDREGLIGNKEDDALEILAKRIGKDRATIQMHLKYCTNLSDDAIQFFIEKQAKRNFFEKMQPQKMALKNKLTEQKQAIGVITETISTFMIDAFGKFRSDGGKIKKETPEPVPPQSEAVTQPDVAGCTTPTDNNSVGDEGNDEGVVTERNIPDWEDLNQLLAMSAIRTSALDASRRFAEYASQDVPFVEIENMLEAELDNITSLLNLVRRLNKLGK